MAAASADVSHLSVSRDYLPPTQEILLEKPQKPALIGLPAPAQFQQPSITYTQQPAYVQQPAFVQQPAYVQQPGNKI